MILTIKELSFLSRHRHSSSFHYRLRRHAHGSSSSSTSLSNRDPERCRIPIHRHRFHRNLRFHFNSLEDDEILNDHGAIIITTVILITFNLLKTF